MNVKITNICEFINAIHDYILEEFEVLPRDFETKLTIDRYSLVYDINRECILPFECSKSSDILHVHTDQFSTKDFVICCNEVDIIALKYIDTCIFGDCRSEIISTLHNWLPAATFQNVHTTLLTTEPTLTINSYFEPSFLFEFVYLANDNRTNQIDYNYFYSNIVGYNSYIISEQQKKIMVNARRRSRSRSASPSGGVSRRRRSRSRSSSPGRPRRVGRPRRSNRASMRSRTTGGNRRRSRSRSRSRA